MILNNGSNFRSRQEWRLTQVRKNSPNCIGLEIFDSHGVVPGPGNDSVLSPSAGSSSLSESWLQGGLFGMPEILVPSPSPGLAGAADGGRPPSENFSNLPGAGANFQWVMQPTALTDQDAAVKREHLAYYFNHVRGLQFLFTCRVALDAIQTVRASTVLTFLYEEP